MFSPTCYDIGQTYFRTTNLPIMTDNRVVVLQAADIKKLKKELSFVLNDNIQKLVSISQSQSAAPVIGSRIVGEYDYDYCCVPRMIVRLPK